MSTQYKDLEIKIKKKLSGDFLGSFQSAFKGLGVEFDSLREYIPGDSIKSIDWKTTAKLGDVHVKNYEEEKDIKVLFMIDNSFTLNFGSENKTKKQTLQEVFFLLSQSAQLSGLSIGSFLNDEFIDFKRGEGNIIKTLSLLEKSFVGDKIAQENFLKNMHLKDTLIFILSDKLDYNISAYKYVNISNELIVVNIFDFFENNLSEKGFEIDISSSSERSFFTRLFSSNSTGQLEEYKKLRIKKIETITKELKKQKIEYLSLDNRDDIFGNFYKFFNAYPHF